jgi:hypothetical protein
VLHCLLSVGIFSLRRSSFSALLSDHSSTMLQSFLSPFVLPWFCFCSFPCPLIVSHLLTSSWSPVCPGLLQAFGLVLHQGLHCSYLSPLFQMSRKHCINISRKIPCIDVSLFWDVVLVHRELSLWLCLKLC